MKSALLLLTVRPSTVWLDFLNKFQHYTVYVIIDDNTYDASTIKAQYTNLHFVQIDEETCDKAGISHVTRIFFGKITAWEKAIYWTLSLGGLESLGGTDYDSFYFMEDDVFIYNEDTLLHIDEKNKEADLLCNHVTCNGLGTDINDPGWHWWKFLPIHVPPPYYRAMMCCIRCSKKMMAAIADYAKAHNQLFFLEALFPTLCIRNHLNCGLMSEFEGVVYRHDWANDKAVIKKENIYHPLKDHRFHEELRLDLELDLGSKREASF